MVQVQDAPQIRDDIPKDFEALGAELKAQIGHPRQVPTGRGEAVDQSCPYRIRHTGKDDGHAGGSHLRRLGGVIGIYEEEFGPILD
jgi:hypothetical protein